MVSLRSFLVIVAASLLLGGGLVQMAGGQTTRWQPITAFQAVNRVTLNGTVEPHEWTDTLQFYDHFSGLTVAFKQNSTGLLMLLVWRENSTCSSCYSAVRLGSLNNSGSMGTPSTPILVIYVSPSLRGDVDEAISNGTGTPAYVEADGYRTQTTCGLGYSSGNYTAECYRPFQGASAPPLDFHLAVRSSAELGLSTGDFSNPGSIMSTDMSTYVLFVSNNTYLAQSTSTEVFGTVTQGSPSGQSIELVVLAVCAVLLAVLIVSAVSIRRSTRLTPAPPDGPSRGDSAGEGGVTPRAEAQDESRKEHSTRPR